jgi:hypothetical protein
MVQNENTVEDAQKALAILYYSFIAGLILFSAMLYFISPVHDFTMPLANPFTVMLLLMTAVMIPLGRSAFQKNISAAATDSITGKIMLYRQGFLTQCAMLQGSALMSVIFAFVTHCYAYYIFLAIDLIVFFMIRPTLIGMKQQLAID